MGAESLARELLWFDELHQIKILGVSKAGELGKGARARRGGAGSLGCCKGSLPGAAAAGHDNPYVVREK